MYFKKCYIIISFLSLIILELIGSACVEAGSSPTLNKGKKWRIGYYEGGPFSDYNDTMRTLIDGLMALGWIDKTESLHISQESQIPYWEWLSQCKSQYLNFDRKDGYSANWDEKKRSHIRKLLLKKLKEQQLDLILALGTWAGQDLANNEHSIPTMVLSTSNPIKAGIIKSPENSGYEHVTARLDPNRYLRQLRMFHRIVGFEKLGIAFEDTPDGRLYSAINEIDQVAKERNFKVVACEVTDATSDIKLADYSCLNCFRKIAQEVDAVYITALTCVDRNAEVIANIFVKNKVPSFSMVGSKFVRKGIMLSISSDSGYKELGKYNANKFGEILNGKKPVLLNQLFEDPLEISVNKTTAQNINFQIPDSIYKIATEIYEK